MILKTFLIKILRKLEDKDMPEVTVDNTQAEQPVVVADAATTVADTTATYDATSGVGSAGSSAETNTASENAPVTTTDTSSDVDTDSVKAALKLAGHDVDSYWDAAVSFGKKIDTDVLSGPKKALVFVDEKIESIFDEAVAIAKLKK